MSRIAVVVPYFNPVGYRSHDVKLRRCLAAFERAGVGDGLFVSGAGARRPLGVDAAFWDEECDFMWHKERLLNQAARRLPSEFTHVVWSDSDVVVAPGWLDAVAAAFDEAPVVQGFRSARYQTIGGAGTRSRVSCLADGDDGASGLLWGAQRSLFTHGPGLFELAVVGSGDAVFAGRTLRGRRSLSAPWTAHFRSLLQRFWSAALLSRLDEWSASVDTWLGTVNAVAAQVDIAVLEHGSVAARRFTERHGLLRDFVPEAHLLDSDDRVLRWSAAGLAEVEPGVRDYFHGRAEDDGLDYGRQGTSSP